MRLLTFMVPRSVGGESVTFQAQRLQGYLGRALGRPVQVKPAADYQQIERDLLSGEAQAAWGPPVVCAWAEAYGGRGLMRGIRRGTATYRAALVARRGANVSLERPGLRAAWVDRDSMGGYLLAQAWLRERGLKANVGLVGAEFLGGYKQVLEAVLAGRADVASVWTSSEADQPQVSAITEQLPSRAAELEFLAYTRDCPHSGVALSPRADPGLAAELEQVFLAMPNDPVGRSILKEEFLIERVEPAPKGCYAELHDTVFKAVLGPR